MTTSNNVFHLNGDPLTSTDFNFTPSFPSSGCTWGQLTVPNTGMLQGQFDFTLSPKEMENFLDGLRIGIEKKKPNKVTREELDAVLAACEEA